MSDTSTLSPSARRFAKFAKPDSRRSTLASNHTGGAARLAGVPDRADTRAKIDMVPLTDSQAKVEAEKKKVRGNKRSQSKSDTLSANSSTVPFDDGMGVGPDAVVAENMFQAQLRKERALADQQQMKAKIMAGELIEAKIVEQWYSNLIIRARDLLIRMGPEMADRLAVETDPNKCAEIVTVRVREVLSGMKELPTPKINNVMKESKESDDAA